MRNNYSNAAPRGARPENSRRKKSKNGKWRLLKQQEVCDRLGISRSTLGRWTRQFPDFPQPLRLGHSCVRWHEQEIEKFVGSRKRVEYDDHAFNPNMELMNEWEQDDA